MIHKLQTWVIGLICGMGIILMNGCVPLIIVTGAAAGGYVISNDSAEANIECTYASAWEAVNATLNELGKITFLKESSGMLNAIVSQASVRVRIVSLGTDVQRVVVSARKNWMPAPKVAQQIFLSIYQKLKYK